jgi:hypothetical protein
LALLAAIPVGLCDGLPVVLYDVCKTGTVIAPPFFFLEPPPTELASAAFEAFLWFILLNAAWAGEPTCPCFVGGGKPVPLVVLLDIYIYIIYNIFY